MSPQDISESEIDMDDALELHASQEDNALAAAQKEIAELKDKHLRAVAELQNMQRRAQRDVEDAAKYGVTSAAKPLLGVADNLERALGAVPQDLPESIANLFEGIRATQRSLQQALEKMGVTMIVAESGQPLNPHEHEVMFEIDTTDFEHGAVVQVLENGYKIHDRLLRPARVSVAKNAKGAPDSMMDVSA